MCSTVQEQITTCGQNAIVKIGERTNIRPQKRPRPVPTVLNASSVALNESGLDGVDFNISLG